MKFKAVSLTWLAAFTHSKNIHSSLKNETRRHATMQIRSAELIGRHVSLAGSVIVNNTPWPCGSIEGKRSTVRTGPDGIG